MAWTAFPTWVVGQVSTASDWNTYVAANMNFLATPPICRVYRSANYGSASSANPCPFDTVEVDSASGYSTGTAKYTVQVAGSYLVVVSWNLASASDGIYFSTSIVHNGTPVAINEGVQNGYAGNVQAIVTDVIPSCAVNDTIWGAYSCQSSLNTAPGAALCYMTIVKVGN